ncbi:MAG TPA: acetate--CoA ligase family protein, partial [Casimicrobiaceae bacterium]
MPGATEMLDGIAAARAVQRRSLNEADGKRLLARFGVSVPRFVTVPDAQAVAGAIDGLRGPFAVKVMSQDILHKSDAGAILLGARDARAVRDAIAAIGSRPQVRSARIDGYLVEEMCAPGSE